MNNLIVYSVFGIGMFCAISICCAASRATWSFARDKAIPLNKIWSQVNHPLGDVPLNANILSLVIQLLLGLIYLGSTAAFNAFVGVAVMCLGASYAMPVAISLANGRKDMVDAPFSLGRWGFAINSFAVLWTAFEIVLFSMPAVIPVTSVSMSRFHLFSRQKKRRLLDITSQNRLCIRGLCRLRSYQRYMVSLKYG